MRNTASAQIPVARYRVLEDGSLVMLHEGRDSLDRVSRGEVLIIRNGLQVLDLMDFLRELSLEAIAAVAGTIAANRIKQDGFTSIHQHLRGNQIESAYELITERLCGHEIAPSASGFPREDFAATTLQADVVARTLRADTAARTPQD